MWLTGSTLLAREILASSIASPSTCSLVVAVEKIVTRFPFLPRTEEGGNKGLGKGCLEHPKVSKTFWK
jgi:hypothetical protein